jgi:exosortase/archaeosortase family protein
MITSDPKASQRSHDFWMPGLLVAFGAFIWMRDRHWLQAADDTLPILAALPLFIWLGRPWTFQPGPWRLARPALIVGVLAFPAGTLFDSTLLLTVSWTALLWSWLSVRVTPDARTSLRPLMVLPFVSFPWLANDFEQVGWWFRLSGAAATEALLSWLAFDVARQGTHLFLCGMAVTVEPACSGLNGLQSLLVAGSALAALKLGGTRLFWWNLPLLVAAAWLANVVRIVFASLCVVALTPAAAARWFEPLHVGAGWLALCAMFALCWLLFSLQARRLERVRAAAQPAPILRLARIGWLEFIILGYCAWQSAGLPAVWRDSPFDRLGWLAFVIWAAGIAVARVTATRDAHDPKKGASWLPALGLAFAFLGDLGELNVSRHLGLALVLAHFSPWPCRFACAAGAVTWLPALGWAGSRLGLDPATFSLVRVGIAVVAVAWMLCPRLASRARADLNNELATHPSA